MFLRHKVGALDLQHTRIVPKVVNNLSFKIVSGQGAEASLGKPKQTKGKAAGEDLSDIHLDGKFSGGQSPHPLTRHRGTTLPRAYL
jgi:hypothetical protein